MNQIRIRLFTVLLLLTATLSAQDAHEICNNQVAVDCLGNSFADPNVSSPGSVDAGLISISYARKCLYKKNAFLFIIGAGPFSSVGYDAVNNETYPITILDIPVGFLWRKNYKRNGLWGGLFFTSVFGRTSNAIVDSPYNSVHKYNFQVSPNITYQFQSKKEHFICRITFAPKFFSSVFSSNYGYRYYFIPWGGISIGGGW